MPDWFLSRLNLAHPTNLLLLSYMAAIAVGTLALVPGADFTVKDSDILIIRQWGLQEGIQFIQKPFTVQGLLEKVSKVIKQSHS